MNTTLLLVLTGVFSLLELAILGGVLFFYLRLRRSETLINTLQGNQQSLLQRIEMNARLEREIVGSFAQRQAELRDLDAKLEARVRELRRLLEQAEGISRSPVFCARLSSMAAKRSFSPAKSPKRRFEPGRSGTHPRPGSGCGLRRRRFQVHSIFALFWRLRAQNVRHAGVSARCLRW